MNFVLSKHAESEMLRRQIAREQVESLTGHPDQIVGAHGGLVVLPVSEYERRKAMPLVSSH